MASVFTVYFDGQFWVGVLEVHEHGTVRAARHVFGAEPTGPELYLFGLHEFGAVLDAAGESAPVASSAMRRANPKRAARLAAREQAARPVSTAAQEAMRRSIEATARQRSQRADARGQEGTDARRERRRVRARARHRGTA